MLTARSDGTKCKPFVLIPHVRQDKNIASKFKNTLELCWLGTNWMNDATTAEYLHKVIGRFGGFFGKRLLIWDSFCSHISKATKIELKKLEINTSVVPGGCTSFIQVYFIILANLSILF